MTMNNFDKVEAIRDLWHCHSKQDLAKMVVEQQEELANCRRMYANASATLGEIQGYLGNGIVGIEPGLVKQLIQERDALAAHIERLREKRAETLEQDCHEIIDEWLEAKPQSSLARHLLRQAKNWTPAELFENGDGEWSQQESDCYVTRSYKDGKLVKTTHHELNDLTEASKETDMHITDKLNQARDERDKAQARYEATLEEHRAVYPWLLIEERTKAASGVTERLQQVIAENYRKMYATDDMTDPANWRAGDWLECVNDGAVDITGGKLYQVISTDSSTFPVIDDDFDKGIARSAHSFRFHSRPTNPASKPRS